MAYQKQTYQDGITEYTDTLYQHMDDGIFGAYPVQLIAISDTAPSQCVENDKYYNTSTKKVYTATGTNTWGTNGETPLEDTAYWLISENGSYAWNGTDLVSIGGGKAEVVISDEEPEEGKLWVDTAEIQTIAGRDRLVNVSNEVDEDYRVNFLKSKNLFDGILELGGYNNNGTKLSNTDNYRNANPVLVKPNTTYTTSINGTAQGYVLLAYDINKTYLSQITQNNGTFTTPANCYYVNFRCFAADFTSDFANLKVQLEEGSTATSYEPYVTPSIYVDNEEIYSKEDTDIVDITNDLTLASGWSIVDGRLYKQGKRVFGDLNLKPTSAIAVNTNYNNIIVIPYNFRTSIVSGGFASTGSNQWTTNTGFVYLYIGVTGGISVSSNVAATYIRVHIENVITD